MTPNGTLNAGLAKGRPIFLMPAHGVLVTGLRLNIARGPGGTVRDRGRAACTRGAPASLPQNGRIP